MKICLMNKVNFEINLVKINLDARFSLEISVEKMKVSTFPDRIFRLRSTTYEVNTALKF